MACNYGSCELARAKTAGPTAGERAARAAFERNGTFAGAARELGVSEAAVRQALKRLAKREGGETYPWRYEVNAWRAGASVHPVRVDEPSTDEPPAPVFRRSQLPDPIHIPAPEAGVTRLILAAAQDETVLHEAFWRNLLAYSDHLSARVMVGSFRYDKRSFGARGAKSGGDTEAAWSYHPELVPYLVDGPVMIGDGLVFCGEMNTLPTAVNPLSGFETYTRDRWGIFPHAKVQLKSVATAASRPAKQLITTGAVTLENYVLKKAGIKASFHHQIAAVIVELSADGSFWVRHLIAEDDGSFQDLDRRVDGGQVTAGHRVEAITWGDIHEEKLDPTVALECWGYDTASRQAVRSDCLLNRLRPRFQFFHDLSDFSPRNHHNIRDPHFLFASHQEGVDCVRSALDGCARFLLSTKRAWCDSVVVQSNHDNALVTWLKNPAYDYRADPRNAIFFLDRQLAFYRAIEAGTEAHFFEDTLCELQPDLKGRVMFVGEDDSFIIAGGIECALHGHLGANGAKGSPRAFTRMGAKSNTGHTHSPEIVDGAYVAGVSGKLHMGYNRGLSSWAHAHIVTYPSGARTILTSARSGRYHA